MKKDILIIVSMVITVMIILTATAFLQKKACEVRAVSFNDYEWSLLAGCMVKFQNTWMPIENVRGVF